MVTEVLKLIIFDCLKQITRWQTYMVLILLIKYTHF